MCARWPSGRRRPGHDRRLSELRYARTRDGRTLFGAFGSLPGAPTYYERPDFPDPLKPRSAFGLPDEVAFLRADLNHVTRIWTASLMVFCRVTRRALSFRKGIPGAGQFVEGRFRRR